MKKILFTSLLLIISASCLAGGQIGTGANGCWVKGDSGIEWRSVEELAYPGIIQNQSIRYKKLKLPVRTMNSLLDFNLSESTNTYLIFKRFERLKTIAPHMYREMMELSKMFNVSYVVQFAIEGVLEGDLSRVYKKCMSFTPAMVTLENGAIIFFRSTWNELDSLSAEIMLIHETLRLAQVHHPMFKDMTNSELQLITAMLFSDRSAIYHLKNAVKRFEARLYKKCHVKWSDYASSQFSHQFLKVFCSGESTIDKLNIWRATNMSYRFKVEKVIREEFFP